MPHITHFKIFISHKCIGVRPKGHSLKVTKLYDQGKCTTTHMGADFLEMLEFASNHWIRIGPGTSRYFLGQNKYTFNSSLVNVDYSHQLFAETWTHHLQYAFKDGSEVCGGKKKSSHFFYISRYKGISSVSILFASNYTTRTLHWVPITSFCCIQIWVVIDGWLQG